MFNRLATQNFIAKIDDYIEDMEASVHTESTGIGNNSGLHNHNTEPEEINNLFGPSEIEGSPALDD